MLTLLAYRPAPSDEFSAMDLPGLLDGELLSPASLPRLLLCCLLIDDALDLPSLAASLFSAEFIGLKFSARCDEFLFSWEGGLPPVGDVASRPAPSLSFKFFREEDFSTFSAMRLVFLFLLF